MSVSAFKKFGKVGLSVLLAALVVGSAIYFDKPSDREKDQTVVSDVQAKKKKKQIKKEKKGKQKPPPTTPKKNKAPSQNQTPPQADGISQPKDQLTETSVKAFEVTAKRFAFEPATIIVKQGDKVKLRVTSSDTTHGFALAEFGINKTLNPGEPVTIEFTADKKGTFSFFCSVVCGSGHSGMRGELIVE